MELSDVPHADNAQANGGTLEVALHADGPGTTRVHVTQHGFEEGVRWRRYYEVIEFGWERALASLKALLEP
jgi:hypothetical protein